MLKFTMLMALAAVGLSDVSVSGPNGEYFNVLGKSGKIDMGLSNSTYVTIRMSAVVERDDQGDSVGKSGQVKHTFNNFASQDFSFGDLASGEWGGAGGVSYVMVPSESQLFGDTNITVHVFMFTEDGTVTDGSNQFDVSAGTFKFSYYVSNWPFCTLSGNGGNADDYTLCTKGGSEEVGDTLDLTITIDSTGLGDSSTSEEAESTDIVWGDGSVLISPQEYRVDETLMTMTDGFPSVETVNETTTIVYRFDRFDGVLYYDPVMGFSNGTNTSGIDLSVTDVNATSPHHGKHRPSPKKGPGKRRPGPIRNGKKRPSPKRVPSRGSDDDNVTLTDDNVTLANVDVLFASHDHTETSSSISMILSMGVVAAVVLVALGVATLVRERQSHMALPMSSEQAVEADMTGTGIAV